MLLRDLLMSQAAHAGDLAWAGSPLPGHAALAGLRAADPSERPVVRVSAIRTAELPAALSVLDDLAEKERAVLLIDALPAEPVSRELAVELAERGVELLHAVEIDDAASVRVLAGLSLQRSGAGAGLAAANLAAVTVDGSSPDWARLRAVLARALAGHESCAETLAAVRAELDAVTAPSGGARPVQGTDRLRLEVPAPVPPGDGRHQPPALRVEVPATSMVGRTLDRAGIGGYEPTTMAWFLALCDTVQPGAVWDVGANLGLYSLLARAYTDREVVAFEPTPEVAGWARQLSAVNGLDYPLEQVAAGEVPGVATFYLSEKSDASNSLAKGFRDSKRQLDVLVEPLDRYLRRTGSVPAVLKIDTETTEHYVLRGAREVVARHRPWIFCEVLADQAPEQVLAALMSRFGYHFFHLNGADPLAETDVVVGDPTLQYMNYLFAPRPLEPRMIDAARAWQAALEATPKAIRR
ncbi:FkbM family methyltransferase [Jiangella ureilytica]|uniref:FkbM family methyltransferase n=1 Tax=Jiangella ureilytica TaxID=2530374 RepID=A0A4R4RZE7_9ACTN|nr:FkbM family methyltransferase [Jiangella ureilytica]TDC54382.1 FkbM family methyltransferase [Jiangella ureilytica]